MKRRVLRTHNNKKVLRTVQAAHQLKDTHHVICDETFLRAVIGKGTDSVRQLVADCLGSCVLHVLPETLRNLERHQHLKALDQASFECLVLDDSCAGDKKNEGDPKPSPRNELKAIAATVKNALPRQFYFVASQSHDLRALLPDDAAILRATFEPLAIWLECNKSNDVNKPTRPKKAALSPADAAFMNSLGLGKKKQTRRQDNNRHTINSTARGGDAPVQEMVETEGALATAVPAPKVRRPHAKTIKGPNPLSMKKKTQRETFSIADPEPPKSKRRTELSSSSAAH